MSPKRFSTILAAVATIGLLAAIPVVAHHAFAAEFDRTKPITLKGKITKVEWVNPHAWIHMESQDPAPSGTVGAWMVECGAPNAMIRRGITKDALPIGVEIVVSGFQALNGSNKANGANITLPDGRQMFVGSSGTGAPYDR